MNSLRNLCLAASLSVFLITVLIGCDDDYDWDAAKTAVNSAVSSPYHVPQTTYSTPPKSSYMDIDSLEMLEADSSIVWVSLPVKNDLVLVVNQYKVTLSELEKVDETNFRVLLNREVIMYRNDTLDFNRNMMKPFVVGISVDSLKRETYYRFEPGGSFSAGGVIGSLEGRSLMLFIE